MSTGRLRRVGDWLVARPEVPLSVAVAVGPIVALISALQTHWYPSGDFAHTELNVRAVPMHLPTIGVAGRFGPFDNQHAHPGPSLAYLLTPVYRLLGSTSAALLVATVTLHLAALVGAIFVARRVGGRSLAVAAGLGALVLTRALGGGWFVTPWNPWMPVTAFYLFLFCILGVCLGHLRLAPLAVLAGTHAAQTHVSYMVLVHGLLGVALAAVVARAVRARRSGTSEPSVAATVRSVGAAAAVMVVMWLPPLYDQLRGTRNLSWLFHHFASPCDPRWGGTCEPSVGLRAATKAMASELNPAGAWVTGAFHDPATTRPSLVGAAAVALVAGWVAWRAWRTRWWPGLVSLGVVAALGALALFSTSRIIGEFYDYVIRWSWPSAAFSAAVLAWMAWRLRPDPARRPDLRRAAGVTAAAWAVVLAISAGASALGTRPPYTQESKLVGGLAQGLGDLGHDRYLLRWHDPAGLGGVGFGLLLQLEREGVDVGTDSWTRFAVLPYRVRDEASVDQVLWVIVGQNNIDAFAARPGARLLTTFDPRTADERRRSDDARALIERRLTELGRDDLLARLDGQFGNAALIAASKELPADVNRAVSVYTDLRLPAAVFAEPPGGAPFAP